MVRRLEEVGKMVDRAEGVVREILKVETGLFLENAGTSMDSATAPDLEGMLIRMTIDEAGRKLTPVCHSASRRM